jgi:UbiD family decarboxylase
LRAPLHHFRSDSGIRNIGTYRAGLKATDRLGVRMSSRIGGAGGYLHWCKYRDRGEKMPCAIVIGAAPVIAYIGKTGDRSG